MTNEQKALKLANDPQQLRLRFRQARSVMLRAVKSHFSQGHIDFENKRFVGTDGYVMQWQTRPNPDEPESYENQQTSIGIVRVCKMESLQ